mgnify:CR=1 FL=1
MSKIILITGGSSGIGRAIATYLNTNDKYIIYGTSRNVKNYDGLPYNLIELDVTSLESINSCIEKVISDHGRIDILINNAGVGITGPMEETPNKEIENHFKTNLYGPINLMKKVLPYMRNNNSGLIINITSVAGYIGTPFRSIYSAGKSSLDIISETLNIDFRSPQTLKDNEEEYNTKKDNDETIEKFSVIPIVKSGTGTDLRKIRYDPDFLKKKKEEEIQQGIRLPNGRKKKKNLNPQKEKTGQFVCPECGIVVVRKSSLKTHIQEVHQGIMYPCDQCPHQARSKRSLKYHIETSHEGKRYYCDQCEYAAISNGNLKKHIRETHCERNHKCDNCDFKAKTAETLKAHINAIHLKIKFTCPDCGSKHSQQGHLTKHRRMKHGYKTREYATHKQFALV